MTTPLPASTDYTNAANQGGKKAFMSALRTFIADLLGTSGTGLDGALLAAPRRVTFGGTADAMTATLAPAPAAYVMGMRVTGAPVGANTVSGPTLNLNGLGAKTVKKRSGTGAKVALVAGDYGAALAFDFEYDGTDFILANPLTSARTDIASAATLDLSATSGALRITGTTAITAVTLASGQVREAIADAALPLTHGASLILPGSANYTCAAGDVLRLIGEPSGVVRVVITRANGQAVVGGAEGYIYIRDEKASGTNGGTFTSGSWQDRTLNTEVHDAGGHATLASSVITLAAGTYRFRARAPAYAVAAHQARLANVTDSTYIYGSSCLAPAGASHQGDSVVMGRFTIGAAKDFKLQHRCGTTSNTYGFGNAGSFGNVEVFAEIELWKEA